MGINNHSSRSAFVISHTDVEQDINIHPQGVEVRFKHFIARIIVGQSGPKKSSAQYTPVLSYLESVLLTLTSNITHIYRTLDIVVCLILFMLKK